MSKTVLFLGNGFDLSLGLRSSYSDLLSSPQFKSILDSGNALAQYIFQASSKTTHWYGLEQELCNYARNTEPEFESFLKDYEDLKNTVKQYYECLDSAPITSSIASDVLLNNYIPNLSLPKEKVLIYNFNYTNTPIRVIDSYMGKSGKIMRLFDSLASFASILARDSYTSISDHISINHVHGSVDSDIVLGVNDYEDVKEYVFLKKSASLKFKGINLSEVTDSDKIIFFGLSLGKPDHHYFQKLFEQLSSGTMKRKKIVFYYHNEPSRLKLLQELDILTSHNLGSLQMNNDVNFIDSGQKYDVIGKFGA